SYSDIFGWRVDASGVPIDATPLLIAGGAGVQRSPMVAWNGQAWLVVYQSQEPVDGYWEMRTRARRVTAEGRVLDDAPLTLGTAAVGFVVAGGDGEWLVTSQPYHADGYGTYLAGQRISGEGVVLNAAPVMMLDWVYGPARAVAVDGGYVVVAPDWNDNTITRARRVTTTLAPVGAAFTLPGPNVASRGSGLYVTWIRNFVDVVGSPVSLAGVRAIPNGALLFNDPAPQYFQTHLAWDGAAWWFLRGAGDDLRTRKVSAAGTVEPGETRLPIVIGGTSNAAYNVSMHGRDGGGATCFWDDARVSMGGDVDVHSLMINADNTPGEERCQSMAASLQRTPDACVGPGGDVLLVALSEAANDDRILFRRLDGAGIARGQWVEVHRAPTIGRASIAWDGVRALVAWDEGPQGLTPTRVRALRLDAGGAPVDAAPVEVMQGFNVAAGALDGRFLVVASRHGVSMQFLNLHGRRIDGASGEMLDPTGGVLLGGGYYSGQPRVRTDGLQWLVCTHSAWSATSSQGDATLARVPVSGPPTLAANPTPVSGATGDLDAACSESECLLVWRSGTLSGPNTSISGRFMNRDGSFRGGVFTIAEAPGRQLRPVATFDGTHYLVAWEDQRGQTSFFDARTDVYGVRLATDGRPVDQQAFLLSGVADGDATPALASTQGVTVAAVARFATGAGFGSYRIGLTRVGEVSCAADFNRDGGVDGADVEAFFIAWEAGGPGTDVNGDGGVDGADVEAFFLAWATGGC
ncbi:MAG: GC-type dockerin domain-anchored protein, partial [Phycisphaerales bacterium]